jgi:hypothetical protein
MRLNLCEKFLEWALGLFSGEAVGEGEMTTEEPSTVRRCANIKSRKTPDAQCSLNATYGDYCSRHWKHPHRFTVTQGVREYIPTRLLHISATKVQVWWRRLSPWLHLRDHGPGLRVRAQSCNDTELYTLDPVEKIPALYYFSFVAPKGALWSFDIRSLGQLVMRGSLRENPYTREQMPEALQKKIHRRLTWLRARKYSVLHPQGTDLTADQVWRQRVLDIFMCVEAFGFHVSCDWFHDMTTEDHERFYKTLFSIWYARLGLTSAQREAIVPHCESAAHKLFRFMPDQVRGRNRHSKVWWERCNLAVMEALLTRSADKEQQRLGAMYVLMGLVEACDAAAESFPWLEEALNN